MLFPAVLTAALLAGCGATDSSGGQSGSEQVREAGSASNDVLKVLELGQTLEGSKVLQSADGEWELRIRNPDKPCDRSIWVDNGARMYHKGKEAWRIRTVSNIAMQQDGNLVFNSPWTKKGLTEFTCDPAKPRAIADSQTVSSGHAVQIDSDGQLVVSNSIGMPLKVGEASTRSETIGFADPANCPYQNPAASTKTAKGQSDVLNGAELAVGASLVSPNGRYEARFTGEEGADLTLHDSGQKVWTVDMNEPNTTLSKIQMSQDGVLVMLALKRNRYSGDVVTERWSTRTKGRGKKLVVTDDGVFAVINKEGTVVAAPVIDDQMHFQGMASPESTQQITVHVDNAASSRRVTLVNQRVIGGSFVTPPTDPITIEVGSSATLVLERRITEPLRLEMRAKTAEYPLGDLAVDVTSSGQTKPSCSPYSDASGNNPLNFYVSPGQGTTPGARPLSATYTFGHRLGS